MATMKEHMAAHHATAAKFHSAAAAEHSGLAALHHGLAKLDGAAHDGAVGEHHKTMAAHHEKLSSLHKGYADHHADQAEKCAKAVDDQMNKLAPTGVIGVTPNNPNIRAVPRAGQREPAKANVPVEFQKLFTVEDEEEARIG
jgi:hypothetical protein